jgi:hypothetical protein
MYDRIIENDIERPRLNKLREEAEERLMKANDEFELAKANSIIHYLQWRYALLKEE